jgi:hypothetical protein
MYMVFQCKLRTSMHQRASDYLEQSGPSPGLFLCHSPTYGRAPIHAISFSRTRYPMAQARPRSRPDKSLQGRMGLLCCLVKGADLGIMAERFTPRKSKNVPISREPVLHATFLPRMYQREPKYHGLLLNSTKPR